MKFNSQICTTKEQSERLLTLGLKKETADMSYYILDYEPVLTIGMAQVYREIIKGGKIIGKQNAEIIPAWSLHRLIEMMPSFIDIGEHTYMFRLIQGNLVSYYNNIAGNALLYGKGGVYDSVIYTIEWLIGEGYFNKEYLEEKK